MDNATGAGAGQPLVAIVTPVYNGAEWLESAALASMKAQTYRPIVHIILDNASTDGTREILEKYAREADFPVVVRRNSETIPQVANFCASVRFVPEEAAYFATLCADDMMKPEAIAEMMAVIEGHPDMIMVGGEESVNDTLRPSYLPRDISVFDAVDMAARILEDDARPPFPHVLFRRDFLRDGEDFFDKAFIQHDTDAVMRVLSQGGAFGFVHKHLFNNLHHPGTVTSNTRNATPFLWERLMLIERYGRRVLNEAAYERVRARHLRIVYRRLAFWRITGAHESAERVLAKLAERGIRPGFGDYALAIGSWPAHAFMQRWRLSTRRFAGAKNAADRGQDGGAAGAAAHQSNAA